VEVVASLSQGRTAAAQCGLFTYKSVPVIFEPLCTNIATMQNFEFISDMFNEHRIYTVMYNRYVELEIYTTGK